MSQSTNLLSIGDSGAEDNLINEEFEYLLLSSTHSSKEVDKNLLQTSYTRF